VRTLLSSLQHAAHACLLATTMSASQFNRDVREQHDTIAAIITGFEASGGGNYAVAELIESQWKKLVSPLTAAQTIKTTCSYIRDTISAFAGQTGVLLDATLSNGQIRDVAAAYSQRQLAVATRVESFNHSPGKSKTMIASTIDELNERLAVQLSRV
jgi:hypothetical protein